MFWFWFQLANLGKIPKTHDILGKNPILWAAWLASKSKTAFWSALAQMTDF